MQRNAWEDTSAPGNAFDCQPARRVPEELHNDSRNLATPSEIPRREGIEKCWSEERSQPLPSHCFTGEAKEKVWTTEIVSSLWLTMPRVSGLVLKGAWQFRSILPLRCIWGNSLTIRNFIAGLWTSEWKFARRRRILRSLCIGSRKPKEPHRWMISSLRNQQRTNFPDNEKLDMMMMMTAALKRCNDKKNTVPKESVSKSRELERATHFSEEIKLLIYIRIFSTGNFDSAHKEDEMNEEDPTQVISDWKQSITDNLEDLETFASAHSSEREILKSESGASQMWIQKRKYDIHTHFHFVKGLNCDFCFRKKIKRFPCRRRNEGSIPWAESLMTW